MNRIKELRKENNIKQIELCKKLGIVQGTLSGWENERFEPDLKSIKKMADIFNVSIEYLLGESESRKEKIKGIKIPVLGIVTAGIPIEAVEDIIDYEEITEDMAKRGNYFGLLIKGDSMSPLIENGDVVIVKQQPDVESGETAIVLVNGNEATCKKVIKQDYGIMLVPNNAAYSPMFYSKTDIETIPVTIIGKVVELRRKF